MVNFQVEIIGANASAATVTVNGHRLIACTSGTSGWCSLRFADDYEAPVALFATEAAARKAAQDAIWNGQRFLISEHLGVANGRFVEVQS
jgi:hypothetical protein